MSGEITTYGALCAAVANALKQARVNNNLGTVQKVQVKNYNEIGEGVPAAPELQVYFESGETDRASENDRASLDATIRRTEVKIIIDCYARVRSHLGADLQAQIDLIDAVDMVLCNQRPPLFGLTAIRDLHWFVERVTFRWGEKTQYAGATFTLTLQIY